MATASDATPKRHLLLLPQELLDIILDLAYPAEDQKRFIDRAKFEKQERERRRHSPSTFAPKGFIHKVDQWMVSKAFFESATRAWVANQHFHDYAFPGPYSDAFARVYLYSSTKSESILVRHCTKLSVTYIPDCGDFNELPSLKYLTLVVDHEVFQSSEPAFAWEVSLSQEQLETVSQQSGLSGLPKLKQIKLVADKVKYAKTKRQKDQWSSNVTALETLLQEQQKSKVVQEPGMKMLGSESQLLQAFGRLGQIISSGATPRGEPTFLPQTTRIAAPQSDELLRARTSQSQSRGAHKLAQVVSQQNEETSKAAANTGVVRVERPEEVPMARNTDDDGKVDRAADMDSVDTPTGEEVDVPASSDDADWSRSDSEDMLSSSEDKLGSESRSKMGFQKKRDAEKFYLPPPKRRALVKYNLLGSEEPARRMTESTSRPALKAERPVLPSPVMIAPLPAAAQEATLSEEISNFLFGGMSKAAQVIAEDSPQLGELKPRNLETIFEEYEGDEESSEPSNMVPIGTQSEKEPSATEQSTRQIFTLGDDLVIFNDKPHTTICQLEEAAKMSESAVFFQGTQTNTESERFETATVKLSEPAVSSQGTQTELELDQAEKITTKLTEAKVYTQSTQTGPEYDEAEYVVKLKKLEQGLDILLASHTEPKPAAEPERDHSILTWMCSLLCFLMCLYILLQIALSTDYVAFRLGSFELVMRRS